MKSRVVKVYEYTDVDISKFQVTFKVNQDKINQEISRVKNHYAIWKQGTKVSKQDMVLCALQSDIQKFNRKKVKMIVGSHLFDAKLEDALIGMNVGEEKKIMVSEQEVAIRVLQVTNKICPELDDSMVQKLNLDGVNTVKDYREYLINQQRQEFIQDKKYNVIQYVRNKVLKQSDFILKREDWQWAVNMELQKCSVLAQKDGLQLETMTEKEFEGKIPVKSYYELVALLQSKYWENLCEYLLGIYYMQMDGRQVDESQYEECIKEYSKTWHETEENAKKIISLEYYLFKEYENYFYNKLDRYVAENLLK